MEHPVLQSLGLVGLGVVLLLLGQIPDNPNDSRTVYSERYGIDMRRSTSCRVAGFITTVCGLAALVISLVRTFR